MTTKKRILLSYLSYLLRLRLLSEDYYLLEGPHSADKTKVKNAHKSSVTKCTHVLGNGSHYHVSTNGIPVHKLYFSDI